MTNLLKYNENEFVLDSWLGKRESNRSIGQGVAQWVSLCGTPYYSAAGMVSRALSLSSSISVIVASVVLQRDAHDLGGVDNPGLDQVDIGVARRVEPMGALSFQHPSHHHAAIDRRVLGNLPRGRAKSAAEYLQSGPLVALGL
jgi:hypothetical protein